MCPRQSLGSEGLKRKVLALERQSPSDTWCSNSGFGIGLRGDWAIQCRRLSLIPTLLASLIPDLEAEASLPEKKGNTLSRDLIDYVRYMVENHGEDYKVSGSGLAEEPFGPTGKAPQKIWVLICLPGANFLRPSGKKGRRDFRKWIH